MRQRRQHLLAGGLHILHGPFTALVATLLSRPVVPTLLYFVLVETFPSKHRFPMHLPSPRLAAFACVLCLFLAQAASSAAAGRSMNFRLKQEEGMVIRLDMAAGKDDNRALYPKVGQAFRSPVRVRAD